MRIRSTLVLAAATLAAGSRAQAACCYFSAKNADILQPAQKVFLTYDPKEKVETFTVQPKFEGNALDFGMVIPTPTQPKLHEMPRDFFKHLAVYTILKKREFPHSNLLPQPNFGLPGGGGIGGLQPVAPASAPAGPPIGAPPPVRVLEAGLVGSLDYKIIEADRADALFSWLKDHKYSYSGDEASLNFYVQKKWLFTVMKIDTMQMKRNKDGTFAGEVTPTRFQFASEKFIYPLKITQISVKDKTEALFYVQAPFKADLQGDFSYQMTWVPMLQAGSGCTPGGLPGGGEQWLKEFAPQQQNLIAKAKGLGFQFVAGQRPAPGKGGRIPTTMEWARKLSKSDVQVLRGEAPYSEKVPDVDEGFTQADVKDNQRAQAVFKVIQARLNKSRQERRIGYLVREAPKEDVAALTQLAGHMQEGKFVTKFRKIFLKDEMNDDLVIVPARYGDAEDKSEYEEILPVSPP
ncbi:MAG: DUF2330 domain-containing protein [Gemmataceae bacterium]|nr:DUF2330 domain-containing protein [Gemmataceae bacterium]